MRCSVFRNWLLIEPVKKCSVFSLQEFDQKEIKTVYGKSILGAPPKLDKKEIKNPKAKKGNTQKPKQKKQHFFHHYGVARHTRPNCYKWLAT